MAQLTSGPAPDSVLLEPFLHGAPPRDLREVFFNLLKKRVRLPQDCAIARCFRLIVHEVADPLVRRVPRIFECPGISRREIDLRTLCIASPHLWKPPHLVPDESAVAGAP